MRTLIDYCAVALLISMSWFLRVMPMPIAMAAARSLTWLFRLSLPRSNDVAIRNIALAFPDKSRAEQERIRKMSWEVLARNLVDFSRIRLLTPEIARQRVDVDGFEALYRKVKAQSNGAGVLFPTMHFGSFEQTVQTFAACGHPVTILARDFHFPRVTKWWNSQREKFGCRIIGRKGGYRDIVDHLKQGIDVTVLFDQNVKVNHAVFVDFLGLKAATTRSLALAALRTGAPILFVTGANCVGGNYQTFYQEVPYERKSSLPIGEQVANLTRAMNVCVENAIRARPEQWFWIHRRFKTRPAGEAEDLYS